jgi:UDP-N-acetylmuramate dehydrogenase
MLSSNQKSQLQKQVPLAPFSTFGIGGNAKYYIRVSERKDVEKAFDFVRQERCPFFILGKGSNILFDDRGFDGLVIHNCLNHFAIKGHMVTAGSGYSFALLGTKAARIGLSGLEFAVGIPGSVGGAVFMNAGANGMEVKDHLHMVRFLHVEGHQTEKKIEDLFFSYRTSPFQEMKGAIIEATFCLKENHMARQKQVAIANARKESQPLWEKSAGCVFRNISQQSSGALIEKCGLKGKRVGGAEVSTLHANFIVNKGNATAKDVKDLIAIVQKTIEEKTGIILQREIRFLPYQSEPYSCI